MKIGIKLPQEGMAMTSGEISEWKVAVGDTVTEGQEIADVEAGKTAFPLVSPYAGKVVEICVDEGDTAMVGDVVLKLEGQV